MAYNTRYQLMPWVKVPQLASHLLGRVAQQIAADWQALYGHPVYLLETFIDPERFRGTCYRAANYIYLGLTTGRGKDDQTMRPNRSLKQLWVYPLRRDFRRCLTLAAPELDRGSGPGRSHRPAPPLAPGTLGQASGAELSRTALPGRP